MILQHGFGISPMRATIDIDFAIQVENWGRFDLLKKKLIAEHHFSETKETHRLLTENGIPVDEVSARFLGRTMSTILKNSEPIKSKVAHILKRETNIGNAKGLIQTIIISRFFPQYSYRQIEKLILALYQGLSEY